MRNTSVAITTRVGAASAVTFTPEDVTVDGETVLVSLGDMDEKDNLFDYIISDGEVVTVLFRQSAGITNPTEAKGYNLVKISFGDAADFEYLDLDPANYPDLEASIIRKISLSEDDGGLNDPVSATGKGYKNSTSLTVFLDELIPVMWDDNGDEAEAEDDKTIIPTDRMPLPAAMLEDYDPDYGNVPFIPVEDDGSVRHVVGGYAMAPSATLDLSENVLCVVASIDGNDVGKCDFTITHPTFQGGYNYVNARDGRGRYSDEAAAFVLEASIGASPAGGSPGKQS